MGLCEEYITCCVQGNPDLHDILWEGGEKRVLSPLAWDTLATLDLIHDAVPSAPFTLRGHRLLDSKFPAPLLSWLQVWSSSHTPASLIMISLAVHDIFPRGVILKSNAQGGHLHISDKVLRRWSLSQPDPLDAKVALLAGVPKILRYREASPHYTHPPVKGSPGPLIFRGSFWKELGCEFPDDGIEGMGCVDISGTKVYYESDITAEQLGVQIQKEVPNLLVTVQGSIITMRAPGGMEFTLMTSKGT